jgi:hypothetical protein
MPTRLGNIGLLQDPVAQQLLQSKMPARLAYTWRDGSARVVPIWFHWDGEDFAFGTPPDSAKMQALKDGTKVALTIDDDATPHRVLFIRGTVRIDTVDGVAPEYEAAATRHLGDEVGRAWVQQMRILCPRMARVFIRPERVALLDFDLGIPSPVGRAMERAEARPREIGTCLTSIE